MLYFLLYTFIISFNFGLLDGKVDLVTYWLSGSCVFLAWTIGLYFGKRLEKNKGEKL